MKAEDLARTGYDKDQLEPEFVKELCRRIDARLDAVAVINALAGEEGHGVTNHTLLKIHGVEQDRRHYEGSLALLREDRAWYRL